MDRDRVIEFVLCRWCRSRIVRSKGPYWRKPLGESGALMDLYMCPVNDIGRHDPERVFAGDAKVPSDSTT